MGVTFQWARFQCRKSFKIISTISKQKKKLENDFNVKTKLKNDADWDVATEVIAEIFFSLSVSKQNSFFLMTIFLEAISNGFSFAPHKTAHLSQHYFADDSL